MEKVLNVAVCGFCLIQLRCISCAERFIELSWKENHVVGFCLGCFQSKILSKMTKKYLDVMFLY